MIENYPTYSNGFISMIDYSKIIKMQSQEPICTFSKKVSLKNNIQNNNKVVKKCLKRTTNK